MLEIEYTNGTKIRVRTLRSAFKCLRMAYPEAIACDTAGWDVGPDDKMPSEVVFVWATEEAANTLGTDPVASISRVK